MIRPRPFFHVAVLASIIAFEYTRPFHTRTWPSTIAGYTISLLSAMVISFFYTTLLWPFVFSPLRKYPSPPDQKWWHFGINDMDARDFERWALEVPNEGIIRLFSFFNTEALLVTSDEILRDALTKTDVVQRPQSPFLELMLGKTSLVLTFGEYHKQSRRKVQPAMNAPYIKNLYPIFSDKSIELASGITRSVTDEDRSVNITEWFTRVTLDIVGLGGFGSDFNSLEDPEGPMIKSYKDTFSDRGWAHLSRLLAVLVPKARWLRERADPRLFNANRGFRANARALITERQKDIAEGRVTKGPQDILDLIMRDNTSNFEELVDYCMTFLVAGHETTSSALTWTMYQLTQHPEIQSRLRSDIRKYLPSPSSGEQITPSHIDQIPALTAFISEALRFHGPVPAFLRTPIAPCVLGGIPFSPGVYLGICPRASNKVASHWPDSPSPANVFDPYRYLSSPTDPEPKLTTGGAKSAYSNMTFSHGPKSCIGEKFARAEMACIMAVLLGKFQFGLAGFGGKGKEGVMRVEDAERVLAIGDNVVGGLWVDVKEVPGW